MIRFFTTEDNFCTRVCVCGCAYPHIKYAEFDFGGANGPFSISITGINNQMPNYSAKNNIKLHVPYNNTFLPMFVYTPHQSKPSLIKRKKYCI